jgi:hypothetical protein
MKKAPEALGTVEKDSGRTKHEKGPDALGTAENEFGLPKHEDET